MGHGLGLNSVVRYWFLLSLELIIFIYPVVWFHTGKVPFPFFQLYCSLDKFTFWCWTSFCFFSSATSLLWISYLADLDQHWPPQLYSVSSWLPIHCWASISCFYQQDSCLKLQPPVFFRINSFYLLFKDSNLQNQCPRCEQLLYAQETPLCDTCMLVILLLRS